MNEPSPTYLMKDGIGEMAIEKIIYALLDAGAEFPAEVFRHDALEPLHTLELKERVYHVIEVIHKHLPSSFAETASILAEIPHHWSGESARENKLTMFAAWPIIDYVATYGIDDPKTSLPLLRDLTPLFSAEFAIRPFLEKHPEETYNTMLMWCLDANHHVRRLASEGIRPRLPWGKTLLQYIADPSPVLSLLDDLKDDPSDYVRRSVANNLNDISKDHPDAVIELCQSWLKEKVSERQWIVRHATRTLVKKGHPDVFPLLGYTKKPRVDVQSPLLDKDSITLGDSITFTTQVTSKSAKPQKIVIDYAIHYVKSNGKTAPKVFKWKNLKLKPGQSIELQKSHSFKKITTRQHYTGDHYLEILLNGTPLRPAVYGEFYLRV